MRGFAAINHVLQLFQFRIRFAFVMLVLQLAGTVMELMSVLILMPIFQFIREDSN